MLCLGTNNIFPIYQRVFIQFDLKMTLSKLDQIYRSILLSKYFSKGWGTPDHLNTLLQFRKVLACRESCIKLVEDPYPITITKDKCQGNERVICGEFDSPFDLYLPSLLPKESKKAYFQICLPKEWKNGDFKPMCLHLAATGEHYFFRRRIMMAKPLLKAGIGSIILENPFYGVRKPSFQTRSILNNVSDIFVMGGCIILEALVIFNWCKQQGYGPLGVSGLSMGGHMASLVATNWPHPLVLVPCLSGTTASYVFTEGVMSHAIDWDLLEYQYKRNEAFQTAIKKLGDDAFKAGVEFVKNFPDSMTTVQNTSPSDYLKSPSPKKKTFEHPWGWIVKKLLAPFSTQERNRRKHISVHFMRGIMDECTHLNNFSKPVDTSLIICVIAHADAYVPNNDKSDLEKLWPGAEIRYLNAGHVKAFLLHQNEFRQAIVDAFKKYRKKYMSPKS